MSSLANPLPAAQLAKQHENFFQKINDAKGTFAAWWAKEHQRLTGELPKIEQVADVVLKYAVPALSIALAAAGGPAGVGVAAASAISDVQLGLGVASGLVHDFGPTPSALNVVNGVSDNLGGILQLVGVKNQKSKDAITKAQGEVQALSTALSAAIAVQQPTQPAVSPAPSAIPGLTQ